MHESLNYEDGELNEIEEELHATTYVSNLEKEFATNSPDNIAQQMWDER